MALDEVSVELRLREIEKRFNDPSFSALRVDWTREEEMRMLADILEKSLQKKARGKQVRYMGLKTLLLIHEVRRKP